VTGHRVRLSGAEPMTVAHCRCGWSQTFRTRRAAALAADAHCFSVAPDAAVEQGMDGGGPWWAPEAVS